MNKTQFENEIAKIQKFMGLNNWELNYRLKDLIDQETKGKVNGQIEAIFYDYFRASISFDTTLLEEEYDYIIHVIFHELSHIYTSNTMVGFENDRDYYEHYIGAATYINFKNTYNSTNEQQTELLARRFKELYLKTK